MQRNLNPYRSINMLIRWSALFAKRHGLPIPPVGNATQEGYIDNISVWLEWITQYAHDNQSLVGAHAVMKWNERVKDEHTEMVKHETRFRESAD